MYIGVNCPYTWANSIDEEDDQTSSWVSDPEGENAEELLVPRKGTDPGSQKEQRDSLINLGTTESRSGLTTSQRLKRWQGKPHKLVKKEVRLRDHQ